MTSSFLRVSVCTALVVVACGGSTSTVVGGDGGGGGNGGDGGGGDDGGGRDGSSSSSGGSSSGGTGSCTPTSGCEVGNECGFLQADGCAAVGSCFPAPGVTCHAYAPGCSCAGKTINIVCTGLPTGYVPAPLAHAGQCEGG